MSSEHYVKTVAIASRESMVFKEAAQKKIGIEEKIRCSKGIKNASILGFFIALQIWKEK